MIPEFDDSGNLPPGIYWATWEEIIDRFGTSERRQSLLEGVKQALMALQKAGCNCAYLNGSFVTSKENPNDFDGCGAAKGIVAIDLRTFE
jgi:hypothetical protein